MTIRLRSVISALGLAAPLLLSGSVLAVDASGPARPAVPASHVVDVHVAAPSARPGLPVRAADRPAVRRPAARAVVAPRRRVAAPAPRPVAQVAARPAVSAPGPAAAPAPRPVAAPAPAPAPRPTTAPARTTGDDYPYRTDTTQAHDRWGFTMRQCVSFAAWRLAQHGNALDNDTQHWGSALDWDDVARSRGVTVSSTPRVGAIAQWNAGEASPVAGGTFTAGSYGHVGWVASVDADGFALVEQYNLGGSRSYSTLRMKAPRYLLMG